MFRIQFSSGQTFIVPRGEACFAEVGKNNKHNVQENMGHHKIIQAAKKKMCLFCYKESIQECFRMQDKSKWYKIRRQNHIFAIQKNIVSNWMSGDIQARW